MKNASRVGNLTRSIKVLFFTNKPNIPRLIRHDDYYCNYYFPHKCANGIDLVSQIERYSKKDAANMLMERGLSSYMGEKVTEYIESEKKSKEAGQILKRSRFIYLLRRFARENGVDISKFF